MPCNKVSYPTQGAALAAARAQRNKKGVLRAYLCFNCGMKWHLTSQSPEVFLKKINKKKNKRQ